MEDLRGCHAGYREAHAARYTRRNFTSERLAMDRAKQLHRVPVTGGDYTVAEWAGQDSPLLAIHGITASHMAWPAVLGHLARDYRVLAPDLRGRGASSELPAPYGFATHVEDLRATLDHFGVARAVLCGHSLGAYISLAFAERYPERVRGLVLVDGGIALPRRTEVSPEQMIKAVLGPALARLEMRFADNTAYHDFWRAHPAFQDAGAWNPEAQAYVDYDLIGAPPAMRSRVNAAAVGVDAHELLAPALVTLIDRISAPMLLLTAPRGLLNQPQPLMPLAAVADKCARLPHLTHLEIADTNHYTIVTGSGRAPVAAAIDNFIASRCVP
jgi:pimeloyl-ACP methyl ester carboxylesterase